MSASNDANRSASKAIGAISARRRPIAATDDLHVKAVPDVLALDQRVRGHG